MTSDEVLQHYMDYISNIEGNLNGEDAMLRALYSLRSQYCEDSESYREVEGTIKKRELELTVDKLFEV